MRTLSWAFSFKIFDPSEVSGRRKTTSRKNYFQSFSLSPQRLTRLLSIVDVFKKHFFSSYRTELICAITHSFGYSLIFRRLFTNVWVVYVQFRSSLNSFSAYQQMILYFHRSFAIFLAISTICSIRCYQRFCV